MEVRMNRLALAVILSTSSLLPAASAHAATFVYDAALSGPNESPPNASAGTGFTTVTYDDLLHTLRVQVAFSGLTGITTASHIHVLVPPALTGGVATQTPYFTGFPLGVTSGAYDNTFDLTQASSWNGAFITANGGVPAGAEAAFALALAEGRTYLNIHTNLFPGGEIRGFLAPAVPEPATWSLLMLGFGLVGASLRRRPAPARVAAAA